MSDDALRAARLRYRDAMRAHDLDAMVHWAGEMALAIDEHTAALASPQPETLDVERLARALRDFEPDDRQRSWVRPDWRDAEAIAREYDRLGAEK